MLPRNPLALFKYPLLATATSNSRFSLKSSEAYKGVVIVPDFEVSESVYVQDVLLQ